MKALIRKEGETVTEKMHIAGIDWNTGTPLTNEAWCGGPYVLVTNYVAPKNEEAESYEIVEPEPEPEPQVEEDTVVINGVTYTKAQLREMLGE